MGPKGIVDFYEWNRLAEVTRAAVSLLREEGFSGTGRELEEAFEGMRLSWRR